MVAEKVEVFTKSAKVGSPGLRWVSDGTGTFEIEEVNGIEVGTQIVLHLKSDCREYADDERVKCMAAFQISIDFDELFNIFVLISIFFYLFA